MLLVRPMANLMPIVTEFCLPSRRRLRDAGNRPNVVPRHHPGHGARACKRLPSFGPKSAPGARRPPVAARRRRRGESREYGVKSGGLRPWVGRAAGTGVKRRKISSSAGAVSRPGWRISNPGPYGNPARTLDGIHPAVFDARPGPRVRTPVLSRRAASPFSCPSRLMK